VPVIKKSVLQTTDKMERKLRAIDELLVFLRIAISIDHLCMINSAMMAVTLRKEGT
jgi:hypothetical protein